MKEIIYNGRKITHDQDIADASNNYFNSDRWE